LCHLWLVLSFFFSPITWLEKIALPGCYKHIGAGCPSHPRHWKCVEACLRHWLFDRHFWYFNEFHCFLIYSVSTLFALCHGANNIISSHCEINVEQATRLPHKLGSVLPSSLLGLPSTRLWRLRLRRWKGCVFPCSHFKKYFLHSLFVVIVDFLSYVWPLSYSKY
jgi:hypothetical protein